MKSMPILGCTTFCYYGIQLGQLIRCLADQIDLGVMMAEEEHIDAIDARWFSRSTAKVSTSSSLVNANANDGANTDPATLYRFKT